RYSLHSMQRYRTKYLLAKLTQYVDMAYRGMREAGTMAPSLATQPFASRPAVIRIPVGAKPGVPVVSNATAPVPAAPAEASDRLLPSDRTRISPPSKRVPRVSGYLRLARAAHPGPAALIRRTEG